MTDDAQLFTSGFSRRGFLTAAGTVGAGIALTPLLGAEADAQATPTASGVDPLSTPRVNGLHLQFGADPASELGRVS
ncbi:MAG: twin-arginine translocation signal domain-containing protein [Actinomycetota bacterium]|nr:twin-arginine translocation signal domain-containing protein [Actinomycetota bacterium]